MLGLFFLTALPLHLCSAVFHLFFCVSLRWARALALLDWSMIVIWLHVSSLPTLYLLLPPFQRWAHLLSSAAVLATWACCAWVDARALARFGVRSTLLIALSVIIRLSPELRVLLSPTAQTFGCWIAAWPSEPMSAVLSSIPRACPSADGLEVSMCGVIHIRFRTCYLMLRPTVWSRACGYWWGWTQVNRDGPVESYLNSPMSAV